MMEIVCVELEIHVYFAENLHVWFSWNLLKDCMLNCVFYGELRLPTEAASTAVN